jgi:hypothetical protein
VCGSEINVRPRLGFGKLKLVADMVYDQYLCKST